jgi:hypothetical protein
MDSIKRHKAVVSVLSRALECDGDPLLNFRDPACAARAVIALF